MREKEFKEKKGVKKVAAKKNIKKAKVGWKEKKAPIKKRAKIGKKKIIRKTTKKEIKKVKAKVKKKVTRKPGEKKTKKITAKIKVKKEEKAKKKVTKKIEVKKVIKEPEKEVKAKKVTIPKKALPRKVVAHVKEKYPPLPVGILPEEYREDAIALMTVDPRKLFIYWEVREDALTKLTGDLNIRLYDVTGIDFDGANAISYLDLAVSNRIGSWYLDVNPEREFVADVGVIDPSGVFTTIARSNKASTPREGKAEEGVLHPRLYDVGLPIGYKK
jgi:hypothetical protein